MIIFLDQSLADFIDKNSSCESDTAIAIDIATEAYRRGHHILLSDISTLDRLISSEHCLHDRTRAILNKVRSKIPTKKSLLDKVNWHIRLTADGVSAERIEISDTKIEIRLPAKVTSETPTLLDRTAFIAENINDAKFYQLLIHSTIASDPELHSSFGGLEFCSRIIPGGGHTTWQLYNMEMDKGENFCLAIVDSDQKFPGGPFGSTANDLCALEEPPHLPSWNCSKLVLSTRSVENLFTISELLSTCYDIDKRQFDIANHLIASHWGAEHWKFLPIKRGIKCYDLFKNDSNDAIYWRGILHATRCVNFSENACEKRESCGTYAIEPLSSQILNKISKKDHTPLVLHPIFDAHILTEVRRIIGSMVALFCAERRSFDRESTVLDQISTNPMV